MRLYPTRGAAQSGRQSVSFSEAVLNPAADFGGLYAPKTTPKLGDLSALKELSYRNLSKTILKLFEVDLDEKTIDEALSTYDRFDDPSNPAPLVCVSERLFVMELWRGPTRAFKDMALQPFGAILSSLAAKRGEKYLILAATSGDTGPATLETFANRADTEVVCIYPDGGTSETQKLQMISQEATNLKVIAIKGDFDDAQSALKTLLSSESFNEKIKASARKLSAANSVNFGRILFQIIYHIRGYLELLKRGEIKEGEAIDIIVPSGNFGNALGAYYARKMGVNIAKIIIASNDNNILTDLIATGRYDLTKRKLIATSSPAMDILKSSNVERILFDLFGEQRTRSLMEDLAQKGAFRLEAAELDLLQNVFEAAWSNEKEVFSAIAQNAQSGYMIDPHTATCLKAARLGESRVKVICSTAEWTKFAPTILNAIERKIYGDKEALLELSKRFDIAIYPSILNLFAKKPIAPKPIAPNEIEGEIISWLAKR
ncbi:MAG: threonine synthase [Helicobacteraceae bacterium]|jgi:threonine synthase|nr:threonine synthase [Helicobacteraceae bacterium]